MTKSQRAEQEKARETLREFIKPGMTVYTILRHRAASGMSRVIDLQVIEDNEPRWVGYTAATAIGMRYDRDRDGIKVSGCGMDMGFHLVYELSHALFPDGFGCIGENGEHSRRCPSNDHSNGDRDYTRHAHATGCRQERCVCHDQTILLASACSGCGCRPAEHWHRDGGYALRHRWM